MRETAGIGYGDIVRLGILDGKISVQKVALIEVGDQICHFRFIKIILCNTHIVLTYAPIGGILSAAVVSKMETTVLSCNSLLSKIFFKCLEIAAFCTSIALLISLVS